MTADFQPNLGILAGPLRRLWDELKTVPGGSYFMGELRLPCISGTGSP
jgi:hypothetical protein